MGTPPVNSNPAPAAGLPPLERWPGEWAGIQSYVLTLTVKDGQVAGLLRHGPLNRHDPARLFDTTLADGVLKGKWESDPEFVEGRTRGKRFGTFEIKLKPGATPAQDALEGWDVDDPKSVLPGGKRWPWNFTRKN